MIYLDTSVVLAQLLSETRRPPDDFWNASFVSSRLLEYEVWNRLHGGGLAATHSEVARRLIGRVALVELSRIVLDRIVEGLPGAVCTLDALHLATLLYLRESREPVELATYDDRLGSAAIKLGIPLAGSLS